jgi:hypothetical protein
LFSNQSICFWAQFILIQNGGFLDMNVYFACSITGGRKDQKIYQAIVDFLLENGHIVPTSILSSEGVVQHEGGIPAQEVYQRDTRWIRECDLLVAEVSTPSHGVGYEIAYALSLGKPVYCCYRIGQTISKMILGNTCANLYIRPYQSKEQALELLGEFLIQHSSL